MFRKSAWLVSGLLMVSCILSLSGPAQGEDIDVEAVLKAIDRGQQYLWDARVKKEYNDRKKAEANWAKNPPDAETKAKIKLDPADRGVIIPAGVWPEYGTYATAHYYRIGQTCLAVYALIESGVSPGDDRIRFALDWLKTVETPMTYELGLRANVWFIADSMTKKKYFGNLKKDVAVLYLSTRDGAYNYFCYAKGRSSGDNSNSQYGLLGVWGGAQAGLPIPKQYWATVEKQWKARQGSDGGWSYTTARFAYGTEAAARGGSGPQWADISSATMSAAGLASMFVCHDNINLRDYIKCNRNMSVPSIEKGLAWFDKNFADTIKGRRVGGYYLYGLERVGLASGYKYFGKIDWYKECVKKVLASQEKDGSWNTGHSKIVSTSYTLLFLARGLHPVLLNKLQFHGDWNNRPRDLASLTRWLSQQFERTLNWQIINLNVPVSELHDAPFLYFSGSVKPELSAEEKQKLKRFVLEGGTIISVTEGGGTAGFRKGIRKLYEELFPDYELKALDRDHPVYSAHSKLHGRPRLFMMSNGVRPIIYHTDEDLSKDWQLQSYKTRKHSFAIISNIVFYHLGGFEVLRPRGTSHWPEPLSESEKRNVDRTVPIAIVPMDLENKTLVEPLAYERFATLLARRNRIKLEFLGEASDTGVPTMTLDALAASGARVAILIGSGKISLSDAQKKSIQQFVKNGGTLLLEAQNGERSFAAMAEPIFSPLFGDKRFTRIPVNDPLYQMTGTEISGVQYRKAAQARIGASRTPMLESIEVEGVGKVYFSPHDLTAGLVGAPNALIDGYEPESSWQIMRNILLQAAENMPEDTGPAANNSPFESDKSKPADEPAEDGGAVLSPFGE